MLYHLYEWQRATLEPLNMMSRLGRNALAFTPLNQFTATRALVAGFEVTERITRRFGRPIFGLTSTVIDGKTVKVTEHDVVKKPFCHLKHFKRAGRRADPTVLVVAPLSGHYATLLRDTVAALLPEHDVYITDWINARDVPMRYPEFHLDDYVDYVEEFIRYLGTRIHVISVCQPTVPVTVAVSRMSAHNAKDVPKSLTLMGGPIDTRVNPTAVNRFAQEHTLDWFKHHVIFTVPGPYEGAGRSVYPGFLQWAGFVALNPRRHAHAFRNFVDHVHQGDEASAEKHRAFYDEYNAVMDLPGEYYLDTIQKVFHEFALPRGTFTVHGEVVKASAIKHTALLTIEGELDDISGVGQTKAAHKLTPGIPAARKRHALIKGVGHYGIFSGSKYRELIYPRIRDFIADFDK